MRLISRGAVLAVAILASLLFGTVAGADEGSNSCLAGKNACASKATQGLLRCHITAERNGTALDPTCTQRATDRFDGGDNPSRSCFA